MGGKCPITGLGGNPTASNKGTFNKDWWPNQLNLKILSQQSNKINPLGIAILNSGEGYGDNWTLFKDTNSQLYKLIEYNVQNNQKNFPKYLLTNSNKPQNCFWPDYQYLNTTVMLCDTFEYLK